MYVQGNKGVLLLSSEQQTTPAPVTQRPKRNTKEPDYLKDYVR